MRGIEILTKAVHETIHLTMTMKKTAVIYSQMEFSKIALLTKQPRKPLKGSHLTWVTFSAR